MNTRQPAAPLSFHPAISIAAKIISYIFHPLFIPIYIGWFFVYVLRLYPASDEKGKMMEMIRFAFSYTALPLFTVLLAAALGFIKSIYLKTQKDRIIPYMACMIFYFWVWYVSKNLGVPKESVMFSLAVFLTTCLGVFFNNYFKVSMHALSLGVAVTLIFILSLNSSSNFGPFLSVALFIAGLVCTARLVNADHHPFEVYFGLLLGAVAQVIAYLFV